jgi:hypothetical protein
VTGLGFVEVTTNAGQELPWNRTRFESAHEPGEDWWVDLEALFIRDDLVAGNRVVLRAHTREVIYLHADSGRFSDGSRSRHARLRIAVTGRSWSSPVYIGGRPWRH